MKPKPQCPKCGSIDLDCGECGYVGEPHENDIQPIPPHYKCRCFVCGETTMPPDEDKELAMPMTFSFGFGPDEAFCGGVAFLCEEHRELANLTTLLLERLLWLYQHMDMEVQ